jgi:hypothetical protein
MMALAKITVGTNNPLTARSTRRRLSHHRDDNRDVNAARMNRRRSSRVLTRGGW